MTGNSRVRLAVVVTLIVLKVIIITHEYNSSLDSAADLFKNKNCCLLTERMKLHGRVESWYGFSLFFSPFSLFSRLLHPLLLLCITFF